MARLSRKQMNKLKEQHGVDTIYSFSRYNLYVSDPYSYFLQYIKHIPQRVSESIYSKSGTLIHETLQDYLEGKIEYDDMINKYEEGLFLFQTEGFVYDCTDKDKNKTIADKYENSVRHFFKNYKPLPYKWLIEKPILVETKNDKGKFVFIGYIDQIAKDGDRYIIEDTKSSSIYTGEKKLKESAQLLLYSLGVAQKFNIGLDQIVARWNFIKYMTVTVDLKTKDKTTGLHKTKQKNCVRNQWVKECQADVRKWLEAEYELDILELENALQTCIERNSLESYPNVMQHFKLDDCYVNVDLTEENVNNLKNKIIKTLTEVEEKTETAKEYLEIIETSDNDDEIKYFEKLLDELFWVDNIKQSDEYYYWNLCSYDRTQHKPWDEYLKERNKEMFRINKKDEGDDVFDW